MQKGAPTIPTSIQTKTYTIDDYENLPESVHAELIGGQMYYRSTPNRMHQEVLSFLLFTIANYIDSNGNPSEVYPGPFAVKLFHDRDDTVEPDISVICDPEKLTDRGCTGAPDWIIEIISSSNLKHDYVRKLNLYLDAGVREYWIVDPRDRKILVYYLKNEHTEDFMVKPYTFQDKVKANIYEDLCIDFNDLNL